MKLRREPSAAERTQPADTCTACRRIRTDQHPQHPQTVDGAGTVPLCVDPTDCRHHAEKVGIYCAA